MLRSAAVAAVLAASLLSACGSSDSKDSTTTKAAAAPAATAPPATPAATTPAATTPTTTTTAAPKLSKTEIIAQCHAAFDPMVDSLHDLDAAAKAGTGLTAYKTAITTAQAGFQKADATKAPKTSSACVQIVVISASRALIYYVAASTAWDKCGKAKSCDERDKSWRTARRFYHKAETAFSKGGPAAAVPPA